MAFSWPGVDLQCNRIALLLGPPFGNLRYHKRLDRFTLRGRQKVDGQWKLFALVHNIEKLAHYAM